MVCATPLGQCSYCKQRERTWLTYGWCVCCRTSRFAQKTIEINGVTIPKGVTVQLPIKLIHDNPEIWPEPEKFDPERYHPLFLPLPLALLPSFSPFLRFTPEEKAKRPALCHIPFGWGPRNCIGMRFALMEVKMALIDVLKKYSFVRTPETEVSSLIIHFELILQFWVSTFYLVNALNNHSHIAKELTCSKFEKQVEYPECTNKSTHARTWEKLCCMLKHFLKVK